MAEACVPFNLQEWIEENDQQGNFRKPVGNVVIWTEGTEFITFVSGGNARNDFHINPGDEIFVQLKGDIRVDLIDEEGRRVINPVREGEVLLIPAGVPHAPRRPAGTWGFIVERQRAPGELDSFAWYCESCDEKLHELSFQLDDIMGQFAQMLEEFNADVEKRTCRNCGAILPVYTEFTLEDQLTPGSRTR
jgi:3-hydroxyanthranilate 3,4-dioxygenase